MLCLTQGWDFALNVSKEILGKSLLLSEEWTKINWHLFSNTDGSVKAVLYYWMTEGQASVICHGDNLEMIPG